MEPATVLQVRDLAKGFPGVQALAGVRLDVARGETHAIVGENGAGKSTLMRLLAGLLQPDAGEIRFRGRPVKFRHPHDALRAGIAMIHQEPLPFPDLSVAENILIGQEPTRGMPGWIDKRRLHQQADRLLQTLGVALPLERQLKHLSVAQMQTVEIARALAHRAELIIMDEPTSAISEREVRALFGIIRDLQRRGVAVLYISHRLEEIFALADTVTVLRDGRHVATAPANALDRDQLIALMVGRELTAPARGHPCPPQRPRREQAIGDDERAADAGLRAPVPGEVALEARRLSKAGRFRDVTFQLRRGEILGLAGLMGAGRTEVASALYGLAPADAGEIRVHGRPVRIASPRDALALGIAMVNEDRQGFGIVPRLSVKANLTLSRLRAVCRWGFIRRRAETRLAAERLRGLSVRGAGVLQPAGQLSGGNQQKVILARALLHQPEILILDEPTRGIDVGAKAEIYALITRWAAEGKAILFVSSELPELLSLCHRLLVMREGIVTAELDRDRTSPEEILQFAMPA